MVSGSEGQGVADVLSATTSPPASFRSLGARHSQLPLGTGNGEPLFKFGFGELSIAAFLALLWKQIVQK